MVDRHAGDPDIDVEAMRAALSDGSAFAAVEAAEATGRRYGVQGTPAWLIAQRLISGLLPATEFEHLAEAATQLRR